MKIKKWKMIIIVACFIAAIIAVIKRQEYTNIMEDEKNIELFSVAPIRNDFLSDSMAGYKEILNKSPIVLRVKAKGKIEYSFKTIKQQVEVLKVYKGNEIRVGEVIEVLTTRQALDFNDMTFNLGFTNLMKKDNEYLIFFDEKIDNPYTGDNIYRISDMLFNPVFNYSDVDNVVIEEGRYVLYSLVIDNEFIVGDSVTLEKLLTFKHELLEIYPK
jgi:hypothetical protein